MSSVAESIVSEAAQGGTLLAYQVGCRYPRFAGIPREPLADMFERHGFTHVAKRLRSVTEHTALAHVCGRPGDVASKGLHVVAVKRKEGSHLQAWVICRASEVGIEDVEHACGARVFSSPAGILSASPVNGAEDRECRALADSLADRARTLASTCDVASVSKACTSALESVAAYPFLSRGSYILRADDPGARRLVALYRDLRDTFYDDARRSGLQSGVAEITGHAGSDNMLAVSDAVINDAEAQVAKLAAQLAKDSGNGKMRPGTLAKHRDVAQAVLDSLRPVRELLGASFDRVVKLTEGVLDSYKAASTATDLTFPEWIAEGARDFRDAAAGDTTPIAAADDSPDSGSIEESPESDPFNL
jgi:hypothetical protein